MKTQFSLLDLAEDDARIHLLHDAEEGIWYEPDVVPDDVQRHWLEQLQRDMPWRSERRPMYEREVQVPRLMATFELSASDLHPVLQQAWAVVQQHLDAHFTHVGLNLYRHGQDSVALHHDRLHNLCPGQPIALLSLGATRVMHIRPQAAGGASLRVPLAPGSLLVMSHASQKTHLHGIPKTTDAVGARISLGFRVRPHLGVTNLGQQVALQR